MAKIMLYTMTLNYGGTEKNVANIANKLCLKHEVMIVVNINIKSKYKLNKKIKVKYIDQEDKSKELLIKKIFTKLSKKRSNKLLEIILSFKPNTIITFLPEPTLRVLALKKLISSKVVVSIRNDPTYEYRYIKYIRNLYFKNADKIILQSSKYIPYFKDKFSNKITVIPNTIEIKTNKIEEKDKVIISVGRLVKQKNYPLLIKAFSKLPKIYNDYELHIYGNGKEFDKLMKYINRLKLDNRIYIYQNEKNVLSKMSKAQVFVLSSIYEGLPNCLLESLSLGIPTVATASSYGVIELLSDYDLGLIAESKPKDLTNKIVYALENQKELQQKALKIKNIIDNDKIYEKWFEIIED